MARGNRLKKPYVKKSARKAELMKSEILRILREAGDECVSGQSLCEKFGVSRQAVWKNISQLKDKGFEIESVSNKGYILKNEPDIINDAAIQSYLSKECLCKKIETFDTLDSTNTKAKQLAEMGEAEGTLIVADEQTAGKGRRGRKWCSKKGVNVFFTLLIRPKIEPKNLSGITLLAAMSVADAVKEVCGVKTMIKWPNDIVLEKKKICGILTEMSSEMNYVNYAVIGIGININDDEIPDEIRENASSIYLETGKKTNRNKLTAKVVEKFDGYYKRFLETKDLTAFIDEYNSMLISMNKEVKVLYGMAETARPDEEETGIARGIDGDGALLVETKDGIKSIVSGEVSVRGLYGYV